MIKRIKLLNFKKFNDSEFKLHSTGISYIAGGNNSGKSTILQALAVWEFARAILVNERGIESICAGYSGQGLGLSDDEFSPILIASLKHLWTNLKTQIAGADGYSLSIECEWEDSGNDRVMSISLALTNDRLFIKCDKSNLAPTAKIPTIAYLPPFAGMSSKENKMSGAERRMMVGKGLAGGVIRNLLLDMFENNQTSRATLKEGRTKIKGSDLQALREKDPWELLQKSLGDIFSAQLIVYNFNELFHTNIKVEIVKGIMEGYKFKKHSNYKARDLMAEGSGFLQWLSVYVLALSGENDVLLLDEPDAHLHPSLQNQLIDSLYEFDEVNDKQVLVATHSTEILRSAQFERIFSLRGRSGKYLSEPNQKVGLFAGLGSDYAPKIDPLKMHKRLLLVEARSDAKILEAWARKIGKPWPKNIVVWPWTGSNKERKQLFLQLKEEVPDLRALSIRDRDDEALNSIDKDTLADKSISDTIDGLQLKVWRRRHIENYCLAPEAISRAADVQATDVVDFFAQKALAIPSNFVSRDVADAMLDARGKELVTEGSSTVRSTFGVSALEIANSMVIGEIADDVVYMIDEIVSLCAP